MQSTARLLAFRPKPYEDELFSSWLVRVAHSQGIKLQTFCNVMWPGKAIWNRDSDRCDDEQFLSSLAEKTGTTIDAARATLLGSFSGTLFPTLVRSGNTRWIMPVGIYHRVRRRFGLQYCPDCLSSGDPYFRRIWRLSLFTFCQRHMRELKDCCAGCGGPILLHRGEMGSRRRVVPVSRAICWSCGCDLRQALRTAAIKPALARQQALHLRLLNGGSSPFEGLSAAPDYFAALGQVLKLLASPLIRLRPFRRIIAEASGLEMAQSVSYHQAINYFDYLRVRDRMRLLESSAWLFEDWPDRFRSLCRISGVRSSTLLHDFEEGPAGFIDLVRSASRNWSGRTK